MSNSDNPIIGADFELKVLKWFIDNYNDNYKLHVKKPICNPNSKLKEKKDHEFDIVNSVDKVAIECKRYTWTKSWNVPSAKMGVLNEAAFYLTCLSNDYRKIIVMLRSYNEKRGITLADYYYNINKHLLGDIQLMEYDPETDHMRCL